MRFAVCQFAPQSDVDANLATIAALADGAAADGARLLIFPEAAMCQSLSSPSALREAAQTLDGTFVKSLTEMAAKNKAVMVVGMYESGGEDRPFNTVVVVGADGVQASHRKSLLYDAFGHRESDTVTAAAPRADVTDVDGVRIGLVTCYEVRFPECARNLVDAGAELLVVCAAWPQGPAKEDHFMTMVRARSLENTVYTAAVGDCGETMVGRSHVVDPLGYQLAGLAHEPGFVCADFDPARIARARQSLPLLEQRSRHLTLATSPSQNA